MPDECASSVAWQILVCASSRLPAPRGNCRRMDVPSKDVQRNLLSLCNEEGFWLRVILRIRHCWSVFSGHAKTKESSYETCVTKRVNTVACSVCIWKCFVRSHMQLCVSKDRRSQIRGPQATNRQGPYPYPRSRLCSSALARLIVAQCVAGCCMPTPVLQISASNARLRKLQKHRV